MTRVGSSLSALPPAARRPRAMMLLPPRSVASASRVMAAALVLVLGVFGGSGDPMMFARADYCNRGRWAWNDPAAWANQIPPGPDAAIMLADGCHLTIAVNAAAPVDAHGVATLTRNATITFQFFSLVFTGESSISGWDYTANAPARPDQVTLRVLNGLTLADGMNARFDAVTVYLPSDYEQTAQALTLGGGTLTLAHGARLVAEAPLHCGILPLFDPTMLSPDAVPPPTPPPNPTTIELSRGNSTHDLPASRLVLGRPSDQIRLCDTLTIRAAPIPASEPNAALPQVVMHNVVIGHTNALSDGANVQWNVPHGGSCIVQTYGATLHVGELAGALLLMSGDGNLVVRGDVSGTVVVQKRGWLLHIGSVGLNALSSGSLVINGGGRTTLAIGTLNAAVRIVGGDVLLAPAPWLDAAEKQQWVGAGNGSLIVHPGLALSLRDADLRAGFTLHMGWGCPSLTLLSHVRFAPGVVVQSNYLPKVVVHAGATVRLDEPSAWYSTAVRPVVVSVSPSATLQLGTDMPAVVRAASTSAQHTGLVLSVNAGPSKAPTRVEGLNGDGGVARVATALLLLSYPCNGDALDTTDGGAIALHNVAFVMRAHVAVTGCATTSDTRQLTLTGGAEMSVVTADANSGGGGGAADGGAFDAEKQVKAAAAILMPGSSGGSDSRTITFRTAAAGAAAAQPAPTNSFASQNMRTLHNVPASGTPLPSTPLSLLNKSGAPNPATLLLIGASACLAVTCALAMWCGVLPRPYRWSPPFLPLDGPSPPPSSGAGLSTTGGGGTPPGASASALVLNNGPPVWRCFRCCGYTVMAARTPPGSMRSFAEKFGHREN